MDVEVCGTREWEGDFMSSQRPCVVGPLLSSPLLCGKYFLLQANTFSKFFFIIIIVVNL
jgi:hypothetical protein